MKYEEKKFEENSKKLYDESVSLIADLAFKQHISYEEMNFLLNLLDMVFFNKDKIGLMAALRRWVRADNDSEIDAIIKATLLATDFNDEQALRQCWITLTELLEHDKGNASD